jgi:hypothetical protein
VVAGHRLTLTSDCNYWCPGQPGRALWIQKKEITHIDRIRNNEKTGLILPLCGVENFLLGTHERIDFAQGKIGMLPEKSCWTPMLNQFAGNAAEWSDKSCLRLRLHAQQCAHKCLLHNVVFFVLLCDTLWFSMVFVFGGYKGLAFKKTPSPGIWECCSNYRVC